MKKLYKSWQWLQNQAKTIETKTIRKYGRSLTFTGIQRMLTEGAVVEGDDKTVILDEGRYRHNKAITIAWLDKEYQNVVDSKTRRRPKTQEVVKWQSRKNQY